MLGLFFDNSSQIIWESQSRRRKSQRHQPEQAEWWRTAETLDIV
jgi:hypothetical protein